MSASRPSGGLGQLRVKNTFIELASNHSNTDSEMEELEQSAAAETSEKAAPEASKSEDSPLQRILTHDCLLPLWRTVSFDSLDGEILDGLCMGETKKDSRLGNVAPAGLTSSSSASAGNAGVEGSPVNYFMDFPVRNSFLEIPAPRDRSLEGFFKEREVRSAPGSLSDRWSSRGSESGAEEEAAALAAAANAAEPKEQRQFRCAQCGDPAAEFGQFDWSDGTWRCKACWVKLCSEGPVDQRPAGSQPIQHFIMPADGSGAGVPFGMPTNPMDGYACLPMAPVQSNVGAYPLMLVSCVPGVPGQWGQQQQPVVPSVLMGSQVVAEADAARPPRNPHWADLLGDEGGAPAWEVVTPPASWADLSGHQQLGEEAEPTLRPRYDLEWKKHDDGEAGRHPEEDEERRPHQYRSQYRFQYQQNGQKVRDSGRRDAARGGNVPQTAAAKREQKWQPKWQPKWQQKWQPKWQPKGQPKGQQKGQQVVKSEVLPPEVLAPKVLKLEAAEKPAVYESEAKKPAAAAPAVDNLNREEPAVDALVAQKLAAEGKPEINGPEEAKVNTCHWCSGDGKQYGQICCYCVSEKDRARLDEMDFHLKKVLACCGGMGPTAKHLAQESLERCSSRLKDMPEDSSKDRLSEALGQFGLDEHAEAIRGLSLGVDSLESLLRLSGDDMERVHNLLEDSGADKQGRRGFRKWLQVPPQGRAGVAPALEPAAGPLDDDDDDEGDEDADGSGEAPGGDDPRRGCNAGKLKERAYFKTDDDARNADAKTVMLRNIPNDYTVGSLMALLQQHDIAYDFLYQPRDWKPERHGSSLGFAFVNCVSHEEAVKCKALNNFKDWNILGSSKVMHVCWGEPRFQGLEKNIERYRNSPVMHPDIRDDWKPMIFESGQRVAFPAPTKAIRRPRNPRAKGANH